MNYKYDALGRLLYRDHGAGDRTYYYWLGLNKIAEGTTGNADVPDDETIDPGEEGSPWDNGYYDTDADRGKVYALPGYANLTTSGGGSHLSFWAKAYMGSIDFLASGYHQVHLLPYYGTDYVDEDYPYDIYIYMDVNFGYGSSWVHVDLDLNARMSALGYGFYGVYESMTFSGYGYLDDIMFHDDAMTRTWQLVPGAAIGGALASQTSGGTKTYYHYNDLGTVQVQTNSSGAKTGLWEPDFYGNYRYAASGSPSRPDLGLTGKMYDDQAGLYYFNARWYDPDRGRFVSPSRLPVGAEHKYLICDNDALNAADPTGRLGVVAVGAAVGGITGWAIAGNAPLPPSINTEAEYACYASCMAGVGSLSGALATMSYEAIMAALENYVVMGYIDAGFVGQQGLAITGGGIAGAIPVIIEALTNGCARICGTCKSKKENAFSDCRSGCMADLRSGKIVGGKGYTDCMKGCYKYD